MPPSSHQGTPLPRRPYQHVSSLSVRDCVFRGSSVHLEGTTNTVYGLTNNLFFRPTFYLDGGTLGAFNNLVWGSPDWALGCYSSNDFVLRDNAFYASVISCIVDVDASHNAYLAMTNSLYRLFPTNVNDLVLSNFTFTSGPLGDYYQLSTNLVDKGSRYATNTGLYHFTTQTNQKKEASSPVDIGLHYVAVTNVGGVWGPIDSDGDGIPDYVEDANGNGSLDSSGVETDWQTYTTITNAVPGLQVFTPLK